MGIERKLFGRTGHPSTRVIFGGAALGAVSQDEADRTLECLLEYGINHLDVAASYGEGEAEKRIGPWMAEHRKDFFLATKTGKRTYQEAREELHGSLERLRVDKVDLIQMHNLIDPDEWEQALGQGGALQTIKSLARRPWQAERTRSTWYQPLEDKDAIRNAVSWVLGDAQVFLIAAGDINLLPRILEVAGQVKSRPADSQMEKMLLNHEVQPIFRGTEFIWQR